MAEFAAGEGILTQCMLPLAYLPPKSFLAKKDISTILDSATRSNNPTKTPAQLAAWHAVIKSGAPVMEFIRESTVATVCTDGRASLHGRLIPLHRCAFIGNQR